MDLGGGGHDHFGLVLTPHKYSMISAVLYALPVYPGTFTIPPRTLQYEVTRLILAHAKVIRVYRETVELKKF